MGINYFVRVLQQGAWPLSQNGLSPLNVPVELEKTVSLYEAFYAKQFSGRKLTWLHHLSNGDVKLGYLNKVKKGRKRPKIDRINEKQKKFFVCFLTKRPFVSSFLVFSDIYCKHDYVSNGTFAAFWKIRLFEFRRIGANNQYFPRTISEICSVIVGLKTTNLRFWGM